MMVHWHSWIVSRNVGCSMGSRVLVGEIGLVFGWW